MGWGVIVGGSGYRCEGEMEQAIGRQAFGVVVQYPVLAPNVVIFTVLWITHPTITALWITPTTLPYGLPLPHCLMDYPYHTVLWITHPTITALWITHLTTLPYGLPTLPHCLMDYPPYHTALWITHLTTLPYGLPTLPHCLMDYPPYHHCLMDCPPYHTALWITHLTTLPYGLPTLPHCLMDYPYHTVLWITHLTTRLQFSLFWYCIPCLRTRHLVTTPTHTHTHTSTGPTILTRPAPQGEKHSLNTESNLHNYQTEPTHASTHARIHARTSKFIAQHEILRRLT